MLPHARFIEFLQDIEPSTTTKANAAAAHQALREHLRTDPKFGPLIEDDFLSGSYKRDTAIRPRTVSGNPQRPDVDVIVVTTHTLSDCPVGVVDALFWAVRRKYPDSRRQGRSVGIIAPLADMDVVPIIDPYGDGTYFIPDRKQEAWIRTNPPGHTQWTIDTNAAAGGRFKPLVKMNKWWRRQHPTVSRRPKGFVIECITAACMDAEQTHYGELFVGTLETIVTRYAWDVALGIVPQVQDPGVPGNSVTKGTTFEAFEGFYRKAQAHAAVGRRALEEADSDKATELWRQIFGDRFPAPPVRTSEGLLRPALVTAASGTLAFPPRAVTPVKPAGFA